MKKVFLNGVTSILLAGVIFGVYYIGCEKGKMGDYQPKPPDRPRIYCNPDKKDCIDPHEVCLKPNAEGIKRCSPDEISVPWDGKWKCREKNFTVICETDTPGTAPGDSGWICEVDEHGTHVCKKGLPRSPGAPGDASWECWWEDVGGGKFRRTCVQYPEDIWDCYPKNGKRICKRENLPAKGEWTCHEEGEGLVCKSRSSGPLDKPWECTKNEYGETVCKKEKVPEPGSPHGKGWKCKTDEHGTTICETKKETEGGRKDRCVPGQERWCDGPQFCAWGRQICRPDGTFANPGDPDYNDPNSPYRCKEDLTTRPNNKCGCRSMVIFNEACCEDQEDRDKNGHPDCLIPADHKNPDCKITGKLCSYCTKNKDCGGPKDLCIYHAYTLSLYCGRDCSHSSCPPGYICHDVTDAESNVVVKQCIPKSGSCENY
jgi:hypothetical protein